MLKPTTFLFIIFFFFYVIVNAQSPKAVAVHAELLQLPTQPLPVKFRAYSRHIEENEYVHANIISDLKGNLKLNGYLKVAEGGDFSINAVFGELSLEKELKTREVIIDDSLKTKATYFYYDISYQLPLYVRFINHTSGERFFEYVEDKSHQLEYSQGYTEDSKKVKVGGIPVKTKTSFSSEDALKEAWEKDKKKTIQKDIKNHLKKPVRDLGRTISNRFDYQKVKKRFTIFSVSKKTEDVALFEQALEETTCAFSAMRADRPVDVVAKKMQATLAFWEKQAEKYTSDKKKESRMKHACLYNIATVYAYLDNFEKAEEYIKMGLTNEKVKTGDFRALQRSINTVKNRMKTNQTQHRHHPLQNGYRPPIAASANKAGENALPPDFHEGLLEHKSGEILSGWIDFPKNKWQWLSSSVVYILPPETEEQAQQMPMAKVFCPYELKSFRVGEKVFRPQPCEGNDRKSEQCFMEERMAGKIKVFRKYQTNGKSKDFAQKGKGELVKLNKKQLAKMIADVPEILAKWQSPNGFTSKTPILDAISEYNEKFAKEAVEGEKVRLDGFGKN